MINLFKGMQMWQIDSGIFWRIVKKQSNDKREIQFNNSDCDVNEENCELPTVDEIRYAIAKSRNGRLSGKDLINAELLKYAGEKFVLV